MRFSMGIPWLCFGWMLSDVARRLGNSLHGGAGGGGIRPVEVIIPAGVAVGDW